MNEHKYSIFAKFIYRYANLPISVLLLIYTAASLLSIVKEWYFVLPAMINAIFLYLINRYYFRNYKIMPFKININNKIIEVSDFAGRRESFSFPFDKITDIQGGIFSGNQTRPIYIFIEDEEFPVAFNNHISNHNELLTTILKNISQDLYRRLMDEIKERNKKFADKLKKRNKKARGEAG